jgi:hypothetical protein
MSSPGFAKDFYYKVINQSAGESLKIKAATEFKIRPIDFSAIKPAELGYASVDEFKADLEPVPEAFSDAFVQIAEEEKELTANASLPRYQVIMLKNIETATSGIIVTVTVKSIVQKWNYFRKESDEFICNVAFTDASNDQILFSGTVNVTSKQATLHLGGNRGLIAVGPGMSFGARMKATAKNIALVLTTIMREGKVEPDEKKSYGIS